MSQQSLLPGFDQPEPTDRLFLAIFPSADDAARLHALAAPYRERHRVNGKPILAERLHVTLFHVGDYAGLPPAQLAGAQQALSQLEAERFAIRFDQLGSFNSRNDNHPYVLTATAGNEALFALQQQLTQRLRQAGISGASRTAFVPHMTVAYSKHVVPNEPIDALSWQVGEVVLIHSLLGQTRHIRLASRALG